MEGYVIVFFSKSESKGYRVYRGWGRGAGGKKSRGLRWLITGSLSRSVPFDELFLHPFKDDIRSTFNGMIKYEG